VTLQDALMTIGHGLALLPPRFDSPQARAMLLAIGQQESDWIHRRQLSGPARGRWQFERSGVAGVLSHNASRAQAAAVCIRLDYQPLTGPVYEALADNDTLALCFARLALWRLPQSLPGPDDAEDGWAQYLRIWQPGRPRPEKWEAAYSTAWDTVGG